ERVTVQLSHARIHAADCESCENKEGMIDRIARAITLDGALDDGQRARLLEIADKCPVHRTLTSEIDIRTSEQRGESRRASLTSPERRGICEPGAGRHHLVAFFCSFGWLTRQCQTTA